MNTLSTKLPLHLTPETLARANRFLPVFATLLLVIGCSYLLSQITWALIPDDSSALPPGQRTQPSTAQQQRTDYSHISQAHLFGIYQQSAATPQTQDAPDTRLNLVLKGVLAAEPMSKASVIISLGKNGKEDMYSIGDQVASATLKEIYADRVILQRSGKLETLRMPDEYNDDFITSSPNSQLPDEGDTRIDTSSPGAALSDIRQEILKNPTSFGKYAIPVPYKQNGRIIGYQLRPQGDRTLFDVVGLDPNDVIVAVNGVQLDDPAEGLKALRELQSASQVNITVLRNGAEMPLQFDIP
jgi:general secretion pathway protein C